MHKIKFFTFVTLYNIFLIEICMEKEQILKTLKTKAASFGFNQKELASIAETISNNGTLASDASEDDLSAAIDAIVPIFKTAQQMAQRLSDSAKAAQSTDEPNSGAAKAKKEEDGNQPEWVKALIDSNKALADRLGALEQEKVHTSRKAQLESILANSGAYGKGVMKAFEKMNFADDAEFSTYLDEQKQGLEEYKQELANGKLKGTPQPPFGGSGSGDDKATQAEIDAVIDAM